MLANAIQLAELFQPGEDNRIKLARQIGIKHAIVGVSGVLSQVPRRRYASALEKIKEEFQAAGMAIAGVESHPVPAEKIKLGLAGRDEEIENYIAAIQAAIRQGLTQWGEVNEEQIWSNIEYFLKAIIPVAEEAGVKMALHPDDPPISPLRGIGRILTSAANYRRVLDIAPSPIHGITYCQANFKLMGEEIASLAREWCTQNKIFFVHFRDVEGTRDHFRETFHDNGPSDMVQMLQVYGSCGFSGPMRPDHAPTLEGESNERPGYAMAGKLFAIGYMKGVLQASGIPYE